LPTLTVMPTETSPFRFAEHTTLRVGGLAARFDTVNSVADAVAFAHDSNGQLVLPVGEGSNLFVADAGFGGWVVSSTDSSLTIVGHNDSAALVRVGAGVRWDDLVAWSASEGLGGLVSMAGIPGLVGAAPVQNIGAYGSEVASVIQSVTAVRLADASVHEFDAEACGFGFRTSRFKQEAGDWLVCSLTLTLPVTPLAAIRYNDLRTAFDGADEAPLGEIRNAVLDIRRTKGMVVDRSDPDTWSAGSFFLSPVVPAETVLDIAQRLSISPDTIPQYPMPDAMVKLAGGWLIERSGITKGLTIGPAGISTRHALALTNRGGATADDVMVLARHVAGVVEQRTGISLQPEVQLVGWTW
jgi:UDP-N-acetylmuramate dehydrogenase